MPIPAHKPVAGPSIGHDADRRTSISLWWTVPAAALVALVASILAYASAPLILPAISVLLVTAGLALGAVFYMAGPERRSSLAGAREVAGALVLLGFAAALLSDSEQALALLDQLQARGLASRSS